MFQQIFLIILVPQICLSQVTVTQTLIPCSEGCKVGEHDMIKMVINIDTSSLTKDVLVEVNLKPNLNVRHECTATGLRVTTTRNASAQSASPPIQDQVYTPYTLSPFPLMMPLPPLTLQSHSLISLPSLYPPMTLSHPRPLFHQIEDTSTVNPHKLDSKPNLSPSTLSLLTEEEEDGESDMINDIKEKHDQLKMKINEYRKNSKKQSDVNLERAQSESRSIVESLQGVEKVQFSEQANGMQISTLAESSGHHPPNDISMTQNNKDDKLSNLNMVNNSNSNDQTNSNKTKEINNGDNIASVHSNKGKIKFNHNGYNVGTNQKQNGTTTKETNARSNKVNVEVTKEEGKPFQSKLSN